jgi:signal transduction histidine kinase
MMVDQQTESGGEAPARGKQLTFAVSEEQLAALQSIGRRIIREPFTGRPWAELTFYLLTGGIALIGLAFVTVTLALGVALAITVFGLAILAAAIRSARGFGGWQRALARSMLGVHVEDPEPFASRRGFFGWLSAAMRDRVGWRAIGYLAIKVPWTLLGFYVAFSLWWDAFVCFAHTFLFSGQGRLPVFGLVTNLFPHAFDVNNGGFTREVLILFSGVIFFFAAPWVMRGFVNVDRLLIGSLLGPDPMATRVRSLEQARTHTVDASAATLRRIERDLHDGTQAQLVALAMRLGMAKEKLADTNDDIDLVRVRELVDEAHRGAKEAIAELRDIARGIHPPALDIGLEGALATLAARSAVPSELTMGLRTRPTPAIEAIAYFCVAELLANVAQHAQASRASVSCAQQGTWLRLVVRDDGRGGAQLSTVGSSSSGLAGLTDRVRAVDGRLNIVSPVGGPTVVTVDLPLSV